MQIVSLPKGAQKEVVVFYGQRGSEIHGHVAHFFIDIHIHRYALKIQEPGLNLWIHYKGSLQAI